MLPVKVLSIAAVMMLCLGGPLPWDRSQDGGQATVGPEDPGAVPRSSMSSFDEDGEFLILQNGLIHLKFNRTAQGGLESVFDPLKGVEFRPDKDMPATLFFLALKNQTDVLSLASYSQATFSYQGSNGTNSSRLVLTYKALGGLDINVTATIEVRDNDPRSYWDMVVDNDNQTRALIEVQYPIIWGLPDDIGGNFRDDILAAPKLDGIVYRDPYPKTQPPYQGNFRFIYPGTLGMQFMALYDPEVSGLYLETRDPWGHVKNFFMNNAGPPGNVMAGISHYGPEVPGSDHDKGYPSVLSIFHGDWYDAADLYKEWALEQDWTSKGKIDQRNDMPEWWLEASPVILIENRDLKGDERIPLEQWSDVVDHYRDLTGTNITLFVRGWEQNGSFTGPYYLPPKDGAAHVTTEVKEVLVAGGHVYFSTSERYWRLKMPFTGYNSTQAFEEVGRPWAVLGPDLQPVEDPGYAALGMDSVVMDTSTQWWQDTVANYSKGVASLAVDVYKLDEFPTGAWVPCYNTSHGHPPGWGRYITDGHLALVDRVLTETRAVNPDMVLATEQASEILLDRVQTYVSRDASPEIALYMGDIHEFGQDMTAEPMFTYVYHQYTTTYGEFGRLGGTDVASFYNSTARAIARDFVRGKLVSGQTYFDGSDDPGLVQLLTRTANATATYGRDYLYLGEMLRPPIVPSPYIDIPYYDWMHDDTGWTTVKDFQVQASAWLSSDGGRIAYSLVNWGNTSVDISFEMSSHHLSNDNYTIVMNRNGERSTYMAATSLPTDVVLTMGPRDVVVLELLSVPDIVIEGLSASSIDPIQGETVELMVEVANRGSVGVDHVTVFIYENDTYTDDWTIDHLGPDSNLTLAFAWSTEGKAPGTYNLTAKVWPMMGELYTTNNELYIEVEVMPVPVGNIRCTVIDNTTLEPISNAAVVLFHTSNRTVMDLKLTGDGTDAIFGSVLPGTYGLNATKAGYITAENLSVAVTADNTTLVALALDPEPVVETRGDILGYVLDANTSALVAGARVHMSDLNMTYYTSMDGMFMFLNVEQGNHTLEVSRHGYHPVWTNITVVGGTRVSINISMEPVPPPIQRGDIVGVVLDQDTEVAISGARVLLVKEGMVYMTNSSGGFRFEGLVFGNHTINVTAQGHIGTDVTVEIMIEGANIVSIYLAEVWVPPTPILTIKGYVRDGKGDPITGVVVHASVDGNNWTAYSNADGFYHLDDIDTGSIKIGLEAKGFRSQGHTLNVERPGTIWLNATLEKKKVTTEVEEDPAVTYVLVALNALMLLGILLMLVTGRKKKVKKKRKKKEEVPEEDEEIPEEE